MAKGKGRVLHPEFFSDADLSEVSIAARLLFAGLWCFACDNGHIENKPKQIKRWIFATDDVNCAELLRELAVESVVGMDDEWVTIPSLTRYQRSDKRWFKTCDFPGCNPPEKAKTDDSQRKTRSGSAEARVITESHAPYVYVDGYLEGYVDGYVEPSVVKEVGADKPAEPTTAPRKRGARLPEDWMPSNDLIETIRSMGVSDDFARAELDKFRDHWISVPGAKGTKLDWSATFRNWIRRAVESQPAARNQPPSANRRGGGFLSDLEEVS